MYLPTRKYKYRHTPPYASYALLYSRNFKNLKKMKSNIFETCVEFSLRERKHVEKKLVEEYCWVTTYAAGGHSAADHMPVFWSLDCICITCICIYSWPYVDILLNWDVRKIRLASGLPERSYCASQGLSVPHSNVSIQYGQISNSNIFCDNV
jgi:hypothetical protein